LQAGKNIKNCTLKERLQIEIFEDELSDLWKRNKDKNGNLKPYITDAQDFNEYTYFYDFVRDALYDEEGNTEDILRHYSYYPENGEYNICIRNQEDPYKLKLDKLFLHVFTNGVGLLSFHLENYQYKDPDDILKINDYGRRIYPQFLSKPIGVNKKYTDNVKNNFLAEKIEIKTDEILYDDNFSQYNISDNNFNNLSSNPIRIPNFIKHLLGGKNTKSFDTFNTNTGESSLVSIKPLLDDRMFTMCWFGNNDTIRVLKQNKISKDDQTYEYNYYTNEFWYKYIFVDGKDLTCQNKNLLRQENIKHTYERHTDWGTLWGVSPYSLVALTSLSGGFIANQISSMYYQMVVLCLMQRTSVLKYSNEIARVSSNLEKDIEDINKSYLKEIEDINKSYLKFINKMYFREVSSFDQGIEMYDMLQENMRIEKEVKDLNRELDELYQCASLVYNREENILIGKLTRLGAWLLPPSLIAGILGMNLMPASTSKIPDSLWDSAFYKPFWQGLLIILVITLISIFALNKWIKIRNK
jgi:Mg2+ and Co2+ transporters